MNLFGFFMNQFGIYALCILSVFMAVFYAFPWTYYSINCIKEVCRYRSLPSDVSQMFYYISNWDDRPSGRNFITVIMLALASWKRHTVLTMIIMFIYCSCMRMK